MPGVIPQKWVDFYSSRFRQKKFSEIEQALCSEKKVLDVGVWCRFPEPNASENWLEKRAGDHADSGTLIAVGLDPMQDFSLKYPHVLCVQANGCALPFADHSVDISVSNAVLEHVPQAAQLRFVEEISRVCKDYALMTVPDRLCPVEIHSRILFLHWLPAWRGWFRRIGEIYWSQKENLAVIFTRRSLRSLLAKSAIPGNWRISRLALIFIPISLIARYTPPRERNGGETHGVEEVQREQPAPL